MKGVPPSSFFLLTATSLAILGLFLLFSHWFFRKQSQRKPLQSTRFHYWVKGISWILALQTLLWMVLLEKDLDLYTLPNAQAINAQDLLKLLSLFLLANFTDFVLNHLFLQSFYLAESKKYKDALEVSNTVDQQKASRIIRRIVYGFVSLYIINLFNLNFKIPIYATFSIDILGIVVAGLIFLSIQLFYWVLKHVVLISYYKRKELDVGTQFAINQILKYILYLFSFVLILEILGQNLTVVWGGLAALLVGVGLGLQQTFNDFFSGFVLLFERTVTVGNIIEVNGQVGRVKKIGLRTSTLLTREGINLIVPNSKITTDNLINWDHDEHKARFKVSLGVAYGTDVQKVKKILLEVAEENSDVLSSPPPSVRFEDFGTSSLDFSLVFWSSNLFFIEVVKSNLRFAIDEKFRENNIQIPFPQRDIWLKNPGDFKAPGV
jgi:small-conductance mechanosensitive channel